ncbi:hypothetical protein PILCRDRAFT_480244 [Piloderma croceum F 1598]|uniref:Uncharacterized protein n=1 Tax=Piloderma croceum (strain F 1598) TaxID=765440 RepID=A0A0C3FS37_PILCF|nr:hypothetical protein PILCRDRAFT_480244 [Piloderma croceum F 1598]
MRKDVFVKLEGCSRRRTSLKLNTIKTPRQEDRIVMQDEISSNRVDQDALDVHWNANQPRLPPTDSNNDTSYRLDSDLEFTSSSMAPLSQPTVSAFFIDRTGLILAVEQQSQSDNDQRPAMFGLDSQLKFIGFFCRSNITLPFFTEDYELLEMTLFQAGICIAGLAHKPPAKWKIPVYCDLAEQETIRNNLAARSTQYVYMSTDSNFDSAVRVYTASYIYIISFSCLTAVEIGSEAVCSVWSCLVS